MRHPEGPRFPERSEGSPVQPLQAGMGEARAGRAQLLSCHCTGIKDRALAPEVSREAAKESSPRREPWVREQNSE